MLEHNALTKRDTVWRAIAHANPPYVPWQLDLTIHMAQELAEYYGANFLNENVGNHLAREKIKRVHNLDSMHFQDMFGVVWRRDSAGDIGVVEDYQLKGPSLEGFSMPCPDKAFIEQKCNILSRQAPDVYRIFEIGFSFFERAWSLRGMQQLLIDMVLGEAYVDELFDLILHYNLEAIHIAAVQDVDAIMFGDDWGQQKGLIMGPALWRRFIKPAMAQMFDAARSHGKTVILHSCGDLQEIMDDLVDMGLDVYNTFQPEIYDLTGFKRNYGNDLTIYGGISTQRVLAHGSPGEVRDVVLKTMDVLGKNGGYIVAPTHQLPAGIPLENVLAFIEAVKSQLG